MWVVTEMDACDVLDEIDTYNVSDFIDTFGRDVIEGYLEDECSRETIDEITHRFNNHPEQIVEWIVNERDGKPLTREEMDGIDLDEDTCETRGIPYEKLEFDEDGRRLTTIFVEPANQLKLFPEMEKDLPPYQMKVALEAVS